MATTLRKGSIDFGLLIVVLFLMVCGVVMVFSASYYDSISERDNPYYFLLRVLVWFGGGLFVMFIVTVIPYRLFYRFAVPIIGICILLLILIFTPLGETINFARRWLDFGIITFMPGEFAKLGVIVFVAWYYTRIDTKVKTFSHGVVPMLCLAGMFFLLIYAQPNLSTAIIICGIIIGMMFVAGIKYSHFFLLIGAGVLGVTTLIFSSGGFHLDRIETFLDPFADPQGAGLQVIQSLLALGAGGALGVGPGNSIQKAQYLPEAQNDFIFAIIGEEYGFVGCLVILGVFLFLIWKGAMVSINAPDRFSMLLAAGVTILIALQVVMNIAVVTSLMPPTGVILPFISYGGNAMLVFSAAAGLLLNVSRYKSEDLAKGRNKT